MQTSHRREGFLDQAESEAAARWDAALRAAGEIAPAARWRQRVAERLAAAIREHHVLVFTCPLDQPERGDFAASPAACQPLAAPILREHLSSLERSRGGRSGEMFPVMSSLAGKPVAERLRRELLEPVGVTGYLCGYLMTPQEELAGWLVVATRRPEHVVLAKSGALLRRVAERATATLSAALDIAESWGALRRGRPPAGDLLLSPRERQILALVSEGLSDVNVAARLSISEATVGSHLHRIYRKLGVHSRVQLVTRAAAPITTRLATR